MSTQSRSDAMDRDEQAALWCMALAGGELSYLEQQEFDAWLVDPANGLALQEAMAAWRGVELVADEPEFIQMRHAALHSYRSANHGRWALRIAPPWYAIGSVAAVLLVAILSFVMLHQPMQVYRTGIGERRVAILDDGSRISLDADTEVDARMGKNRRDLVLARGRAKFDVARDPLRPFSVTVGDRVVVATGTSFSVEMLRQDAHVLLYEGHVAVLDRDDDKPVRERGSGREPAIAADEQLTPGKELVVALNGAGVTATVAAVDPLRSLYWEAGQLSFDDEPLPLAVDRMNRYSAQKLVIGDAGAAHILVNGVFDAGNVDAFVEALTTLDGVAVTRLPSKIILSSQ